MKTLRQIPLHMLLLAGLVSPMQAKNKDNETPAAKVAASDEVAYAGLNVGPRTEAANATVPAGVGIQVGFIDPKGPSVGKVEEGDILTRLDDQMLFNADQFRALVRTRKPGEKVKLTLVRGVEPQLVELTLGSRAAEKAASAARSGRAGVIETPNGITIAPGGAIPPELLKQLQDLQSGAIPPPARSPDLSADELRAQPGARSSSSHSFSFSFGNGAKSSSTSMASDSEGTVSLEEKDGKKHAVVKDRAGKTLFDGDVTDKAAVEKLPADVRQRLKLVEGKNFTLPGFPLSPPATPAEEPKKKFDPKQGA
ncbi:MAG: Serine protease Do-like HtrA [Verrucomicrobiota bacterium]